MKEEFLLPTNVFKTLTIREKENCCHITNRPASGRRSPSIGNVRRNPPNGHHGIVFDLLDQISTSLHAARDAGPFWGTELLEEVFHSVKTLRGRYVATGLLENDDQFLIQLTVVYICIYHSET